MKTKKSSNIIISRNKRAPFDFKIEDKFEAGVCLEGWEVKSIRAGKINIAESFIQIKNCEVFWFNCHITPLTTASTHIVCQPTRVRKLLLNRKEIDKLSGLVNRQGFTIVPLSSYWKNNTQVKLEIGLGKGKKIYDKRMDIKKREWVINKARAKFHDN